MAKNIALVMYNLQVIDLPQIALLRHQS